MPSHLRKRYRINDDEAKEPNSQQHLDRLTRSMVAEGNFFYIDIDHENGYQMMNECNSSDEDDEVDKLGKYVVNLNNPNSISCKTKKFIYAMKDSHRTQDRVHNLLQRTLQPPQPEQTPSYLRTPLLTLSQPPTDGRSPTPLIKRRQRKDPMSSLPAWRRPKVHNYSLVPQDSPRITKTNMKGIRMHLPSLQRKKSKL